MLSFLSNIRGRNKKQEEEGYHADHRLFSLLLIIARSFLLKLRGRQSRDVTMEMTTFFFLFIYHMCRTWSL